MLGGRCVRCGANEDLEFDHIDPSTKVFAVTEAGNSEDPELFRSSGPLLLPRQDSNLEPAG
jgi:hypothetical protein